MQLKVLLQSDFLPDYYGKVLSFGELFGTGGSDLAKLIKFDLCRPHDILNSLRSLGL